VNALLLARRKARTILGISTVTLGIDGVVALLLIPSLGVWGAVAANVSAQVTSSFLFMRAEFRGQGYSIRHGMIAARTWLLGALSLVVALVLGRFLPVHAVPIRALCVGIVGGMSYLVLLWATGGVLGQADRGALLDATPRRLRAICGILLLAVAARHESIGE
jgi:peptidoglycan biosynthesis protein MviN/MurJ (putative lipid II flippase)